jgi:hypothetical protein
VNPGFPAAGETEPDNNLTQESPNPATTEPGKIGIGTCLEAFYCFFDAELI